MCIEMIPLCRLMPLAAILLVSACSRLDPDSFEGTSPSLRSNAAFYKPGDPVKLRAELHGPAKVRVYQGLRHSLALTVSLKTPGLTSNSYDGIHVTTTSVRMGDARLIGIQDAVGFDINGTLSESPDRKYLILDFSEYGSRFEIDRDALCKMAGIAFTGYWKPIRPAASDSLEDSTNQIVFKPEAFGGECAVRP